MVVVTAWLLLFVQDSSSWGSVSSMTSARRRSHAMGSITFASPSVSRSAPINTSRRHALPSPLPSPHTPGGIQSAYCFSIPLHTLRLPCWSVQTPSHARMLDCARASSASNISHVEPKADDAEGEDVSVCTSCRSTFSYVHGTEAGGPVSSHPLRQSSSPRSLHSADSQTPFPTQVSPARAPHASGTQTALPSWCCVNIART